MDEFRLDMFPDSTLIGDLVIGPGAVSISKVGEARYEISIACDSGRQLSFVVWTTEKGIIDTQLSDSGQWAFCHLQEDGSLKALNASACSIHFEHMDRGHYWLGLNHSSGDTMHINFTTPGYLKSKVLDHVVPSAAN